MTQALKALYGSANDASQYGNLRRRRDTIVSRLKVNRPIVPNFERDVHQRGSWSSTDLLQRAAKHKEKKKQSTVYSILPLNKTGSVVRTRQ